MTLPVSPASSARSRFRSRIRSVVAQIVLQSYVLGFVAAIVLGSGYMTFAGDSTSAEAQAQTLAEVERRTIVSSVKATGKVTYANEQQLRFNQKGKVARVLFQEGAAVTKGQLIAELDTTTILADIRQAQLSVAASALQLQQLQTDKEKSLLDSQNALRESERQFADAQNTLVVAKEKLPTDVAGAKRSVEEKKSALAQAKAALEQATATTIQDLASTAQSILSESEDLIDTLYGILVNDASARASTGNKSIEIYHRIGNDLSQKDQTERSYYAAREVIDAMRARYGTSLPQLRDTTAIAVAIGEARASALAVHTLADQTYRLLQGSATDPHDFTVNDVNALKQSAVSARSSATTLMSQAETAQASLTGDAGHLTSIPIQQKHDALVAAEHALTAAEENLGILQTQTPGDLQKQEASVAKIQDDFKAKQAALTSTVKGSDVNVRLKQNDIAQKAASLQKTRQTIEDYQLKAPFDGIIRRMDYQVGDNLLDTGEEKYVTLENPAFLVVTVLLDQVDVVRVRKEMNARIVFDALPEQTFQGVIHEISSTPVETSGVVSYEVAIRLATPKDLTILSGMTATVDLETTRKENVLVVPNLALQRSDGTTTIRTSDGQSVAVQTGATDGRYTEILSGLQEGDQIVSLNVSVAPVATGGAQNPNAQIFRLGAGGGGVGGGRGGNFQRAP
jgi:HlyD family secretion protein